MVEAKLLSVSASGSSRQLLFWSFVVVSPEPAYGVIVHLLDAFEVISPQPFGSDNSVLSFDIGILLRLARLDID